MFHDVLCDFFMNETADGIDDVIMSKDVVEMIKQNTLRSADRESNA